MCVCARVFGYLEFNLYAGMNSLFDRHINIHIILVHRILCYRRVQGDPLGYFVSLGLDV